MKSIAIVSAICSALWAAPQAATDARPAGVLQSVDAAAKKLVLKTDAGSELNIAVEDSTSYVRVKPGEKDLANAQQLKLSDLAPGDRVLVQGSPAKRVIVMAKSDVAAKHAADRAEWEQNGILGTVGSVDAAGRKLTVNVRSGMPPLSKPVEVALAEKTIVRRYAPDSVKFADAKQATLADVKVGDQVRARGRKSSDGAALTADELVAGTFRNIAATIESIDAASNAIRVKDLDGKKSVLVKLSPDSSLRRMPEMMARMMANVLNNNGDAPQRPLGAPAETPKPGGLPSGAGISPSGSGPAPPPGIAPPDGARPAGGPGMARGRGFSGNPAQMLERMPPLKLDELKTGDALIIASTEGSKPGEVTAITLVAGVEPLLTAPSKNRQSMLGNWNLDMNMGMGAGMGQ